MLLGTHRCAPRTTPVATVAAATNACAAALSVSGAGTLWVASRDVGIFTDPGRMLAVLAVAGLGVAATPVATVSVLRRFLHHLSVSQLLLFIGHGALQYLPPHTTLQS